MLWIERYRPEKLTDIVGQDTAVSHLSSFAASGVVPHLILSGPHGTGKSAAIECLAKALYKENWELNTSVFQTADLFLLGKAYLEQDDRYTHLYQKNQSLITNFKYIIRWYASLRPLDAEFKLMVFEDAHTLTKDAQHALRRIMERASTTCRFIFSTTNQSAIIPPVASRCLPLFFSPVDQDSMLSHLRRIRERENSGLYPCTDDDLDLIAQAAQETCAGQSCSCRLLLKREGAGIFLRWLSQKRQTWPLLLLNLSKKERYAMRSGASNH